MVSIDTNVDTDAIAGSFDGGGDADAGGGGDVDVDVGGGPNPGDVRVDTSPDDGGGGTSGGGGDTGGTGVDVSGGPNPGDVQVDTSPDDGGPSGGGDGGTGQPAPTPGDVDRTPDPRTTDQTGRLSTPNFRPPDPEPTQGIETVSGAGGDVGLAFAGRRREQQILEQNPGLSSEDVRVRRDGSVVLTSSGRDVFQERAAAINDRVSSPAGGFESIRGGTPDVVGANAVSQPSGGFETVRGGGPGIQPPTPGSPDDQLNERITRALEGIGVTGAGANRQPPEAPGRPSLVEQQARRDIERQLEQQVGTDLAAEDIAFTQQNGVVRGRLTEEARQDVRVGQEPLVQLAAGTPLEDFLRGTRETGLELAAERRGRRSRFYDTVGQRDRLETAIDRAGLGGLQQQFEQAQASAQQELADIRSGLGRFGGRASQQLETAAVVTGAAPIAGGLQRAGVDPTDTGIPSPTQEPEAFIAAGAPIAAAEPTPFGEAVLGTVAGGTGILAARRRVDRGQPGVAQAEATAEVPGMFPPEQEQPTEPIGRGFFRSEQEVEPPSFDLPELLTPADRSAGEGPARLTPPELGTPSRPASQPFASEIEQPQSPPGRGFFPTEVDVPTAQAGQAVQQQRGGQQPAERTRRRPGRGRTVPDNMLPDEPATIGGQTGGGVGQTGQTPGPRFIFRPNPRSMELRRIETPEGGFRIGPEFTRFLGAQQLDRQVQPELTPFQRVGTLPPAAQIQPAVGAAAAARGRQRTAQQPTLDVSARLRAGQFGRQGVSTRAAQRTGLGQRLRDRTDTRLRQGTPSRFDQPTEPTGTPTTTEFIEPTPELVDTPFDYGFGQPPGERPRRSRDRDDDRGRRDRDAPSADARFGTLDVIGPAWLNQQVTAQAGGGIGARGTPENVERFAGDLTIPTAAQANPEQFGLSEELEQVEALFPGVGDSGGGNVAASSPGVDEDDFAPIAFDMGAGGAEDGGSSDANPGGNGLGMGIDIGGVDDGDGFSLSFDEEDML